MSAESHNTPLLSAAQAADYLLLTEGRENGAAVKALYRLCDQHKIRPVVIGTHRRFAVWELDRFIKDETEIKELQGCRPRNA